MQTDRKIGIEMEGYVDVNPRHIEILGVRIRKDGSLSNYQWMYRNEPYGVELVTRPMRELNDLQRTWDDMRRYGWSVDNSAGTHIHVDISDYSTLEMVKLLSFAKTIEDIMFLFMEDYRSDNEYCEPIHPSWKDIASNSRYADVVWNRLNQDEVNEHLENSFGFVWKNKDTPRNDKYQWLNVFGSNYTTAEYRLFHAVTDIHEVIKQAKMAEAITNLVKASSPEQLMFITDQIFSQKTIKEMVDKFFEALSLDFTLPIINHRSQVSLEKLYKEMA